MPRERGKFRRLVQDRVAGEERRYEDVRADIVRIIPRGDVGHDAERLVRDHLLEPLLLILEHLLFRHHRARVLQEEVDARLHAFEFIGGLRDRLADFGRQGPSQPVALLEEQLAELPHRFEPSVQGDPGPVALGVAGARHFLSNRARRVLRQLGQDLFRGGIGDFYH